MRRALAVTLLALLAPALPGQAQEPPPEPTLGSAEVNGTYGKGFGEVRPVEMDNGGVPSGQIFGITWEGWGGAVATGRGEKPQYRPTGGYFRRRVETQLRASRRGECADFPGFPAYTRLMVRARRSPGGPWEQWLPWRLDACDPDAEATRCRPVAFTPNSDHGAGRIEEWDTTCREARVLARASRSVRVRDRFHRGYRLNARGFDCRGWSDGYGLPRINWTCTRDTALVTFVSS